jgi:hypothetical protein
VIYDHLAGEHTIGVHPLLEDDTCHFLAVDFDEAEWRDGSSISWTPDIRRCCGCGTSGNVATGQWATVLLNTRRRGQTYSLAPIARSLEIVKKVDC